MMNKDTTLIILYYRVSLVIVIGWLTFNRKLVILMSLMQQVFDVNWGFSLTVSFYPYPVCHAVGQKK